ncbi:exodeoxyribonuclease VII large subunit [Rhodobacteraceae bacterium 2CG4]|uniref:Exodeoxyribonuclease 7 large subunit n=1 Tax=Halovulum marinum TaxID=2662447 RepID=A0A6L5Z221_9RHOB|nr:exodeoxyribonuclease VII large subunit [Halovulum marinum]MSU90125.1 exodeoxyribonuclease VII large subunit [Halovulum marinum]
MSDLFDDPDDAQPAGGNAPEFTVSELSGAVKRTIEGAFTHVRVRGEVGRVSRPRSGHVYLDLKDDRSVLAGVIWKGNAQRLRTQPEEGMEVIATGRLTTFPGQSRYQIVIEDIAPAGVGALMAMLEKRRTALAAEGLFDEARKRPLPYLPEVIGVVTSPSGAVIRDILHRLRDRFPRKVLVWPVAVQGDKCAAEVAAAIRGFNALAPGGAIPRPDVLIVARGGGSIEDLWGFNEEIVVRAAADSGIPLISAVGHETDTTLIDFASDRRAPTPTAAAEMAVPVRRDLAVHLGALEDRRRRALAGQIAAKSQRLQDLSRALPRPEAMLGERAQRLDACAQRLPLALTGFARHTRLRLSTGPGGRFGPQLLSGRIEVRQGRLQALSDRLPRGLSRQAERARARLDRLVLRPRQLEALKDQEHGRLDRAVKALARCAITAEERRKQKLRELAGLLRSLGYTETLRRGFAVVRDDAGALVQGAEAARAAPALEIEFADGRVPVLPGGGPRPARKPRRAADDPGGDGSGGDGPQGTLF